MMTGGTGIVISLSNPSRFLNSMYNVHPYTRVLEIPMRAIITTLLFQVPVPLCLDFHLREPRVAASCNFY